MKAKEFKEILKNVHDDNPIGFYVIGVEWTDEEDVNRWDSPRHPNSEQMNMILI